MIDIDKRNDYAIQNFIHKCSHLLSISPTFSAQLLRSQIPKAYQIQLSHQYLFTLSGSTLVKAVHKELMKLSPDLNSETDRTPKFRTYEKLYHINKFVRKMVNSYFKIRTFFEGLSMQCDASLTMPLLMVTYTLSYSGEHFIFN